MLPEGTRHPHRFALNPYKHSDLSQASPRPQNLGSDSNSTIISSILCPFRVTAVRYFGCAGLHPACASLSLRMKGGALTMHTSCGMPWCHIVQRYRTHTAYVCKPIYPVPWLAPLEFSQHQTGSEDSNTDLTSLNTGAIDEHTSHHIPISLFFRIHPSQSHQTT